MQMLHRGRGRRAVEAKAAADASGVKAGSKPVRAAASIKAQLTFD
jgi:hypothetical protein